MSCLGVDIVSVSPYYCLYVGVMIQLYLLIYIVIFYKLERIKLYSKSLLTFTLLLSVYHRCTKWSYVQIREVHKRRYLLRHCALEVFSNDGQSLFLIFHLPQRDKIYQKWVTYLTVSHIIIVLVKTLIHYCGMDIHYVCFLLVTVELTLSGCF